METHTQLSMSLTLCVGLCLCVESGKITVSKGPIYIYNIRNLVNMHIQNILYILHMNDDHDDDDDDDDVRA